MSPSSIVRPSLLSVAAVLVLFALVVSGCQPPSAPTVSPDTAAAQPEAEADPQPEGEADPEPAATEPLGAEARLVVYSGRSENLAAPLIEEFRKETGLDVEVRYGGTSELAATILEEGDKSPADVYYAQDAGALGALAAEGRLSTLPDAVLNQVDPRFHGQDGTWVGTSGRGRVVVYNDKILQPDDLPASIWDFTDPKWKGKLGWSPTNGSFQAFITALRLLEGEDKAREWVDAMIANEIKAYPNNDAITEAVSAGEIEAGFINHYYVLEIGSERGDDFHAAVHNLSVGDAGSMINVAGVGILDTASHRQEAERFVNFLLSKEAQTYFASKTWEYPLAADVAADPSLIPLDQIKAPALNLSDLKDLAGTLELLQDAGALD